MYLTQSTSLEVPNQLHAPKPNQDRHRRCHHPVFLTQFAYFVIRAGRKTKNWDRMREEREASSQLNDIVLLSKAGDYLFDEGPDFVALEVNY